MSYSFGIVCRELLLIFDYGAHKEREKATRRPSDYTHSYNKTSIIYYLQTI